MLKVLTETMQIKWQKIEVKTKQRKKKVQKVKIIKCREIKHQLKDTK